MFVPRWKFTLSHELKLKMYIPKLLKKSKAKKRFIFNSSFCLFVFVLFCFVCFLFVLLLFFDKCKNVNKNVTLRRLSQILYIVCIIMRYLEMTPQSLVSKFFLIFVIPKVWFLLIWESVSSTRSQSPILRIGKTLCHIEKLH